MKLTGKYFYGNEISKYGQENNRLDYATLAKAFDAVLNNDIMNKTYEIGYWEMESGFINHQDEIEELRERIETLEEEKERLEEIDPEEENEEERLLGDIEEIENKIQKLEDEILELEEDEENIPEVYQWYIVSDPGAHILEEINEIVYYNDKLDMYLWGVTHWGTAWDYVLTDVPCNCEA